MDGLLTVSEVSRRSGVAASALRFYEDRGLITSERADWAKISGAWGKRIDARVAELQRLRTSLTECIGCGCLSLQQCRFANPGDRAGRSGPGPRSWIG
jgi:MerR family redox-sensitive transcriptional activator SoxR